MSRNIAFYTMIQYLTHGETDLVAATKRFVDSLSKPALF